MSEGLAGQTWEPSNRMMLFLLHPLPEISVFSFASDFPFIQSSTVSYVSRLSHPSKMADWKINVNKRLFVRKKIRNVNRGLTDNRHAGFDLYLQDYIMKQKLFSNLENPTLI
jgi:hypothetical protein